MIRSITLSLLLLIPSLLCYQAQADELLLAFRREETTFTLVRKTRLSPPVLQLSVRTRRRVTTNIFTLQSNNRIVIDLFSTRVRRNYEFPLPNSPVLEAMRLGAHADKLRIVFDIKSKAAPRFTWKQRRGRVIVRILETADSKPLTEIEEILSPVQENLEPPSIEDPKILEIRRGKSSTPIGIVESEPLDRELKDFFALIDKDPLPTATPPAIATATETATATPPATATSTSPATATATPPAAATAPPTPTLIPSATPTLMPPATSTPTTDVPTLQIHASPAAEELVSKKDSEASLLSGKDIPQENFTGQQIQRIDFSFLEPDKTPVLKIVLNKQPRFRVIKTKKLVYTVILEDCRVPAEHLKLPQFPPHDFIGFSYIAVESDQKNTAVQIGVERGTRIVYFTRNKELWIKAVE